MRPEQTFMTEPFRMKFQSRNARPIQIHTSANTFSLHSSKRDYAPDKDMYASTRDVNLLTRADMKRELSRLRDGPIPTWVSHPLNASYQGLYIHASTNQILHGIKTIQALRRVMMCFSGKNNAMPEIA